METDQFEQFTDMDSEDQELERLFTLLSQNNHFSAYEYIHIKDNKIEGELMDDEILKAITNIDEEEKEPTIDETIKLEKVNYTEAEKAINTKLRFLFEQEAEFGKVEEDVKVLRVLRCLHRRIKLLLIKNLKQ
ncbi:12654_t:CDS:1, partial [Funneliformis geosporum]